MMTMMNTIPVGCSSPTKTAPPFQVCRSWRTTAQYGFRTRSSVIQWSFARGRRVPTNPNFLKLVSHKRPSFSFCPPSCLLSSQVAEYAFTFGTVAVLPFYALMVVAPNSVMTKKSMESSIPYVILGVLYAYLLHLSWKPETIQLIFANKYWLPELSGMVKMFSSEMTMASAWIHLLIIDLFAARQIFRDGLKNDIETRHSISLCLFFCPIGIVVHELTKVMTRKTNGN